MFARVITAEMDDSNSEQIIDLANQQLPDARRRPGFEGFFLLINEKAGRTVTISLWNSLESMEAVTQGMAEGIHDEGAAAAALASLRLDTYEVALHADPPR